MTSRQRGGGPRSLGASLLDAVLAETVDPAYAQAAAARTAQDAGDRPRTRWRARTLVALTMVVAGLLVAVTYDQAAAGAEGREQVRAALIDDIDRESGVSDELAVQLEDLTEQVTTTRDQVLAANATGQGVLDDLADAERGAGAQRVTGPGLMVTLANADPKADEDPVGGTTEEDPRERVQDGDLQLVVNALWSAGAEAVSINGQRLGPTTAIRFAGEAVLVDFRPVTNPYEVSAIGDPDSLSRNFLDSSEVRALAVISESFGLRFELSEEDELTLPAATTPEVRLAAPGTAASPATDPTPGG